MTWQEKGSSIQRLWWTQGPPYTVLPQDMLDQLGIEQEGQRIYELGDDRVVEYPTGYARMRLDGDQTIILVVFGPEGADPLLGATALEHSSLALETLHGAISLD